MQLPSYFILIAFFLYANPFYSQVGVGTSNPSMVARMEVSSQTNGVGNYKGFILPRVPNSTARNTIAVTYQDAGLMVYVEDIACLQLWNGSEWLDITCALSITAGSVIQDFELTPAIPELPIFRITGGEYTTGLGDYPNSSLYVSGARGFGVNNGSSTLILGPVDISSNTDATFKLRLAGFSFSAGNGMDNTDTVLVSISTTGVSGTFSDELIIVGGSNSASNNTWGFTASRLAATNFDGNNIPLSMVAGTGNNSSTGGISYLEINGIPNTSNLAIKITLLNNKANELWVIDDAQVIGN